MTVNPKEKLKKCPRCGSKAQLKKWIGWYVACTSISPCGCLILHDYHTKQEAINAWNKHTGGNNE